MAQIFLSYSRSDSDFVELIEPRIAQIFGEGLLWYDRKPDGLKGGQIWWSEILREIQNCQIFLFLLSDESAESEWCTKELEEAAHLHKTIIPVLLETYSSKEYPGHYSELTQHRLQETQYVDLRTEGRDKYDDLSPLWGAINRAQRPSLSRVERWMLWNQLELLRRLGGDEVQSAMFDDTPAQQVLSHGYERNYFDDAPFVDEEYSYNDGEEVYQILDMFYFIQNALEGVGRNETAIEVPKDDSKFLVFMGFSVNWEPNEYFFAEFLHEKKLLFQKVYDKIPEGWDANSPFEMLPRYRSMLTAWRQSEDFHCLTREDLLRIADAAKPPHRKFERKHDS